MNSDSLQSHSSALRTPDQVQEDLLYLQEHRVCETLEFIVKGLLRDQPEDPILSICNMLRTSNRSTSSVRFSGGSIADRTVQPLSTAGTPVTPESGGGKQFPTTQLKADSVNTNSAANHAGLSRAAATCSCSSRADTPSSVPPARWHDGQSSKGLERDESSRSDGSAFSISSIDMSEFLSEFRAAHLGLFGEQRGAFISIQDLADIVDRIVIPLPDVKLLVDLFQELKEPSDGLVSFDAFLARMNYKIQGRYPLEIIRCAFYSLLSADEVLAVRPPSAAVGSKHVSIPGNISTGSNLDAFLMGSSNLDGGRDSFVDPQSAGQFFQSIPSANATLERISRGALWHGLGLRHDTSQLEALLAPFRKGSEYVIFFTDLLKIVQTLCAGHR